MTHQDSCELAAAKRPGDFRRRDAYTNRWPRRAVFSSLALLALQSLECQAAIGASISTTNLLLSASSVEPSASNGNGNGENSTTLQNTTTSASANPLEEISNQKFPLYMRIVATLACLIIFTIGVCGNLLVPLVVIKTKYLRNSTNLFLINLSIADLLVLIVCMPTVLIELHSRPETWLLGEPMCKLSNYVEMLAANGSIFTILAISFERYYAICKPLKAGYKCTRLRATIIICIIWLLASVLTSPILIMAESLQTTYIDGSLVYNCILQTDSYWAKMYVFVSMFAFFCLPLLVLMLVYWLISKRLIRENLAMSSTASSAAVSAACGCACTCSTAAKQNGEASTDGSPTSESNCQDCCRQKHHFLLRAQKSELVGAPEADRNRRVGGQKTASLRLISTFLSSLHHNHYHPFTHQNHCSQHNNNNNVNDSISSEHRRSHWLSGKAISFDHQLLAKSAATNSINGGNLRGQIGKEDGNLSSAIETGEIPKGQESDTLHQYSTLSTSRGFIRRLLRIENSDQPPVANGYGHGYAPVAQRLSISETGNKRQADKLMRRTNSPMRMETPTSDTNRDSFTVTDDQQSGSQAPFLSRNNSTNNHTSDDCDGSRISPIGCKRKRKLHTRKHANLTTTNSSDPYRFKWIKRFSVSSSTASVQTSSTTLPSDASISPSMYHYNCSSKQPSPRSILHGSQSKELSSQQHGERKKFAHFDSDVVDQQPQSEDNHQFGHHRYLTNATANHSSSSQSSPSPDMSKSSSPDSMFHQVGGNGLERPVGINRKSPLCRQNTSLSIVSSRDGDLENLDNLANGDCQDRNRDSITRKSFTATSTADPLCANNHDLYQQHSRPHRHSSGHYNFMRFKKSYKGRSGSQPSVCSHMSHQSQYNSPEMMVVHDLSKKQQMHSRRQVVVMLAFVVACFFLLFFPYRVFTIWLILSSDDQVHSLGMEAYYNLTYFSRILIYLHSAINPIAYNLISTKFRRAFMSILLCRGPATRRHFTTEHRIINNSSKYVVNGDKKSLPLRQSHR